MELASREEDGVENGAGNVMESQNIQGFRADAKDHFHSQEKDWGMAQDKPQKALF